MSKKSARAVAFPLNLLISAAIPVAGLCCSSRADASSCEGLASLKLPDTTIESAQSVPSGDYTVDKTTRKAMPAFCRVVASVKAAPDSDVRLEIWLPDQWKGVFHGNGNGGYAGIVSFGYDGMEAGVKRGYASASTDMGTAPSTPLNGDALVGHPQKWKDWGLLSTHVMTVAGKEIAKAFYGEEPKHSYFTGCSTGGQQGRSSKRPPTRPASRPSMVSSNGCSARTGTGAISASSRTCPRSTRRSDPSSMARRPATSASFAHAAGSS